MDLIKHTSPFKYYFFGGVFSFLIFSINNNSRLFTLSPFKPFKFNSFMIPDSKKITSKKDNIVLNSIKSLVNNQLNNLFVVRFQLKGIGYKFTRPKKFRSILRVELGYSVFNYLSIPNSIKIKHSRTRLIIFGYSKSDVIRFSKIIYFFRPADPYKAKGVRYADKLYDKFKAGKQRLLNFEIFKPCSIIFLVK